MYETTCDLCLFCDQCPRPIPCSNFTLTDEDVEDFETVERNRMQFYDEWHRYIDDED